MNICCYFQQNYIYANVVLYCCGSVPLNDGNCRLKMSVGTLCS